MLVFDSLDAVPDDFGPSAVTIGKFDGVHAGHRRVLAELRELARPRALATVALTFDRNPLSLLRPEACPDALISNQQKLKLIAALGIDAALMLPFDRALSELSPEGFVRGILVDVLAAHAVLVGSDFRFGAGGSGTVASLRELGGELGFEVFIVDDVLVADGRRASSTWIRELLADGRVGEAGELLGYPPTLRAVVVRGQQRGRALGYPTANLSPQLEGFIPADGVYAGWATVGEDRFAAAISIGNNPTFEGVPEKQVEAHLLDQDLDLYDRVIELAFVERIRGMVKFSSVPELVEQMVDDESRARDILGIRRRL